MGLDTSDVVALVMQDAHAIPRPAANKEGTDENDHSDNRDLFMTRTYDKMVPLGTGRRGGENSQRGLVDPNLRFQECPEELGAFLLGQGRDIANDVVDFVARGIEQDLAFEVQIFSLRFEQGLDAAAMLRAEWDDLAMRARSICPLGETTGQQAARRRLADAQYAAGLSPADADARVRADLAAAPAGTPCAP